MAQRKDTKRYSSRAGGKPSGMVVWLLWLIVIGLLSVIARYAYIGAQPDRGCYTLIGRSPACEMAEKSAPIASDVAPKAVIAKGYTAKDRAKLNDLIDDTAP